MPVPTRFRARLWLGVALVVLPAAVASAQPVSVPSATTPGSSGTNEALPSSTTAGPPPAGETQPRGLFERDTLFGDPGGVRSRLSDHGISFGLQESSEVLGNATGGVRRSVIYEGTTELSLGIDFDRLAGIPGGVFNVSAWQIHGRGLSQNALGGNFHTVSSDEALRGTLLFELWYEQTLLDNRLAIRVGQLSADTEFQISSYAALFVNHTFGWASQPSSDLPSGGPSYPLATPGVRVRARPTDALSVLLGVFNGDPAGPGTGNAQLRDPSGTAFRTGDGVFVIGEAQYAVNSGEGATGLPGTYRVGAWYNSNAFADLRTSSAGSSLAASGATSSAAPVGRSRRNNYGVYAIADQLVWRPAEARDGGVGVFARAMGSPGDRNILNFYADAGVTWKGAIAGRDNDTVGLAVAYARISDTAAKLDSDIAVATHNPFYPIRRNETVLELTYQYQIAPWWQLQPDAQYVFNLNGGVPNPLKPGKTLGDAAVFGLRTLVTF